MSQRSYGDAPARRWGRSGQDDDDRHDGSRQYGFGSRNSSLDTFSRSSSHGSNREWEERSPLPIPEEPPFTARINNLSYDTTEDQVLKLLSDFSNLKVESVRIIKDRDVDRSAGYGFADFADAASLKEALSLSGKILDGREVRIMVSEGRKGNRSSDRQLDWASARNKQVKLPPQVERKAHEFRRSRDSSSESRGSDSRGERGPERIIDWSKREGPLPPLSRGMGSRGGSRSGEGVLPRSPLATGSSANEEDDEKSEEAKRSAAPKMPKQNPFAGAKPVDNKEAMDRVEKKIAEQRRELHKREKQVEQEHEKEERNRGNSPRARRGRGGFSRRDAEGSRDLKGRWGSNRRQGKRHGSDDTRKPRADSGSEKNTKETSTQPSGEIEISKTENAEAEMNEAVAAVPLDLKPAAADDTATAVDTSPEPSDVQKAPEITQEELDARDGWTRVGKSSK